MEYTFAYFENSHYICTVNDNFSSKQINGDLLLECYTHHNSVHDCDTFHSSQTKEELPLIEPLHSPTAEGWTSSWKKKHPQRNISKNSWRNLWGISLIIFLKQILKNLCRNFWSNSWKTFYWNPLRILIWSNTCFWASGILMESLNEYPWRNL